MPNKYEREIEEILRNLDQSAPKPRLSQRFRRGTTRRPRERQWSLPAFHFGLSDWCLIIAWIAALIGGGWAFAQHGTDGDLFTGSLALLGLGCMVLVVVLAFTPQSRYPGQTRPGNVTTMRRNPLGSFSTRWNLFLLKRRYQRRKDRNT
jgi:hypothetical protein